MTREHFAESFGQTPALMASLGEIAVPCDCGWDECQGWQYLPVPTARDYAAMGHLSQQDIDDGLAYAATQLAPA